ncbi:UNVERIFIED_CONTAM: 8-hydroxyquercetin 8-O-methyltransferase [Sesamum latifolium]|uniref:8-hydroxyquercetin 8-O-methyltransferase n=1 Tax=Sesamum latifolium TaxID=2727402 RepID=A0AAW2WQB5_9LAMI
MALSSNGIQSTQELPDAHSHVWNHLFNFINSMSLKCVIQLGIPDIILKHGKPITLSELTHSLRLNEAKSLSLERLMRSMVHSKFFINVKVSQVEETEGYWLTPASHLLLRDEPWSSRPFAFLLLDRPEAELFLQRGTVAKAIADAFPGLKCVVLDLPHVVAGCEGTENLTFVAGDMFEYIPPADAVFMKWILHDWPDEKCIKILEKCRQAISNKDKEGKVIIVDLVVDFKKEHKAIETQLFFDMIMMFNLNSGRERIVKDWAELFAATGFTSYKITPLFGLRSLIEIFP